MPQQLELHDLDSEIGDQPQRLFDWLERAKGLLVAVAVHQHLVADRAKRQLQPAGLRLAHQEFLEQQRMGADRLCGVVVAQ